MERGKASIFIIFLLSLIVIAGCSGKDKKADEVAEGTDGVIMEFAEGYPQDKYVVSAAREPISVFLDLKNKGAYPKENPAEQALLGQGKIFLNGFDAAIIDIEKSSNLSKLFLLGKSSVNPQGGIDTIEFSGNIIAENLQAEEYNPTILATLCYPYVTKASPTVCIDPSPFDKQNKVCEIEDLELKSQGAPIAITKIEEDASGKIRRFKINIKNAGGGDVINFASLEKCDPSKRLKADDFDFVELISAKIGTVDLLDNCEPFAKGSKGINNLIRLFNGEGSVACTLDISELGKVDSAFITPLNIKLRYGYRSTISKQIEIEKLGIITTVTEKGKIEEPKKPAEPKPAPVPKPKEEPPVPAPAPSDGLPDLDVLYIERTPRYNRYEVHYSLPRLAPGTEGEQRWPKEGEFVEFKAHIKNKGSGPSGASSYKWSTFGIEKSGTHSSLAPGEEGIETLGWRWKDGNHNVKFEVDPDNAIKEISENNNQREDRTNALSFRIHVEKTVYKTFNGIKNVVGSFSFEDWVQAQADALNKKFKDSEVRDRVRIDEIVVEDDNTLPRTAEHAPKDLPWDGRWGFETDEWCSTGCPNIIPIRAPKIQFSLIHEWAHQLGMAHNYDANVLAKNNKITGKELIQRNPDILGAGKGGDDVLRAFEEGERLSSYFVFAMNANYGKRRGYYGDYLFDVLNNNILLVKDAFGNPLKDAKIKIWQSFEDKTDAKKIHGERNTIGGEPIFTGTTDSDGKYSLPNQKAPQITTATGHTLKDNPFGEIDVNARNGLFLIEVSVGSKKYYHILTIHDFNLAYWRRGSKDTAEYTISTNLVANADPTNLALNKPAIATCKFGGQPICKVNDLHAPGKAVDGDKTTSDNYWAPFNNYGAPGDWWQVDLESSSNLYKINVYSSNINYHEWFIRFHIDISTDATSWVTVATEKNWGASIKGGQVGSYTFKPTPARYVRIVSDYSQNYVKLQEVEVFRVLP